MSSMTSPSREPAKHFQLLSAKELSQERGMLLLAGIIVLILGFTPYFGPIIGFGEGETTAIVAALSFGDGSGYDEDNDGIAALNEVVDFNINPSFGWNASHQHLAAWWRIESLDAHTTTFVCNGAELACDFVGTPLESPVWDIPLYVYYGLHGATENNTVSVQILYVNYSLDIENASAEVYYSDWETLPAIFVGNAANETNETNLTAANTPPLCIFPNITIVKNTPTPAHLDAYCSDAEADALQFAIGDAENLSIDQDGTSGMVVLAPLQEYIGTETLAIAVDDGINQSNYSVDIVVYEEPAYSLYCAEIPNMTIYAGTIQNLTLSNYCSDEEGNNISYNAYANDISIAMQADRAVISANDSFIGNSFVFFIANNSEMIVVTNAFLIEVTDPISTEHLIQLPAEVGKPVKWEKRVSSPVEFDSLNATVPKEAQNITVARLDESGEHQLHSAEIEVHDGEGIKTIEEFEQSSSQEDTQRSGISSAFPAAADGQIQEDPLIVVSTPAKEILIEYETQAPTQTEKEFSKGKKEVTISSEFHYVDVLAATDVPDVPQNSISLYWIQNGTKLLFSDVSYLDTNNNTLIDRIEWVVPHLSNQTFEVELTILNVQSYPLVGGEWEVRFTTLGTANLNLSAANGTTYAEKEADDGITNNDLSIKSLKCGNDTLFDYAHGLIAPNAYIVNGSGDKIKIADTIGKSHQIRSLFVEGYNCDNKTGYWIVDVQTPGVHIQRFDFGNATGYAKNYALLGNVFVDNTHTDFGNGTLHLTNVSGSGPLANVTLNFTPDTSGINRGNPIYQLNGNFTSRIMDSKQNHTVFDKIGWAISLVNSSDVSGIAMDSANTNGNEIAVFYRNGSMGVLDGLTSLGTDFSFTSRFGTYSIPAGIDTWDIIDFAFDDDASDTLFLFLKNGTVISSGDLGNNPFVSANPSLASFSTYTLAANFNVSNVLGIVIDSGATQAAAFMSNGSILVATQEAAPFSFTAVRAFTYSGFSGFINTNVIAASYDDSVGDIALFFRNGSYVADTTQTDFTTDVQFSAAFVSTYNSNFNISASSNITLLTRVSNDSITFTPWSSEYSDSNREQTIAGGTGRYIQYQALFSTPSRHVTPLLENVSINYTIDIIPPAVNTSINNTLPYFGQVINFTANLSDNSALAWCRFYDNISGPLGIRIHNYTLGGQNNKCSQNYTISVTRGSVINFTLLVNDTYSNINRTQWVITTANALPSSPNILLPQPNEYAKLQPQPFNVTFPRDLDGDAITIRYYIDGAINQTTPFNTTFNATDGYYILNVSLTDGIGWSQNATTNFTLDTKRPSVSLLYPLNGTWDLSGLLQMSYIMQDINPSHCTLFTNVSGIWLANQTNSTQISDTESFFNATSYPEGNYIWNTYCNDTAGNIGFNSSNYSVSVDTNNPRLQFVFPTPANNSNLSVGTQIFNATHNDSNAHTLLFSLNASFGNLSFPYLGRIFTNVTNTSLHGSYSFYFWANDSSGRYNQTDVYTANIDTRLPAFQYVSPANNTWNTSMNISFQYQVQDDFLGIKNCTLFIDGMANLTNLSVEQGTTQYFNLPLNNTAEGIAWNVNCTDYAGNSNATETRIIKIDTTFPSILNGTINTTRLNVTNKICLNATVNDTFSLVQFVYAEIDRPESTTTNISLTNDTLDANSCDHQGGNVWSYAFQALEEGPSNWTAIYVQDFAGNINSTKFNGLNWSQVSSVFVNSTLLQPLGNIEINESDAGINYSFTMRCNVSCRLDSTLPCQNVHIFPQYLDPQSQMYVDMTNFTDLLFSSQMNKSCGLLNQGSHCNTTFQITSRTDAGNNNFTLRCRSRGSNTPQDFSEFTPNLTVNDYPVASFSSPIDTQHIRGIFEINASASTDDQNITRYLWELDDNFQFTSPTTLCTNNQTNCTFNTLNPDIQNQCINETPNCFLRLNVTDADNLKNSTFIQIQIDNSPPKVRLEMPPNLTYSASPNVSFEYAAFDTNLSTCSLYHNETGIFTINETNSTVRNNTQDVINITLLDNLLVWNIGCNDTAGNLGFNSTNYTLIVDTIPPAIRLNLPSNNTLTNNNTPLINFTVWDINLKNCSVYANFSGIFTINQTFLNPNSSQDHAFASTPVADGFYEWNAQCNDFAGNNAFNSTNFTFRIDTTPPSEFNLSSPFNDTQSLNRAPFMNWTESSDDNFLNYTLLADDSNDFSSPNFAYKLGGNSSNNSFYVPDQWGGNALWYWKVVAYDVFSLSRNSTDYFVYIIDNLTPQVTLLTPFNHSIQNETTISFKFNVTDQFSVANCSLVIANSVDTVSTLIIKNVSNSISTALPNGVYNWSINCTDKAGNVNRSAFRNITIDAPALITNKFVDTSETDFGQGTLHLTNITGSGSAAFGANVTLNYTILSSGIAKGINNYTLAGNFTSQIFNTYTNITPFGGISWAISLPNSSDVMGYEFQTSGNDLAVFYRNGSYGSDTTQTDLASPIDTTLAFLAYSIPPGWSRDDIVGFAADDDNGPNAYAFFKNGSVAIDAGQADFATAVAFATTTSYTLPPDFNVTDIIDFAFDTVNNGAAGTAAVFFRNGSYAYTGTATETGPFAFDTISQFTIAPDYSASDALGIAFDSSGQAALFFRNRSYLSDGTQADLASQVNFATTFLISYHANANITESTNITMQTRISNSTTAWPPWSQIYVNYSGQPIGAVGQYIQYKAALSTNDKYIAPSLLNVSINYTDVSLPNITFVQPTPSNNSLFASSHVFVNTSIIDAVSIAECTLEFDNSNISMLIKRVGRTANCYYNKTAIDEGKHGFRVYANDTFGNMGMSETRNITIDVTAPTITFLSQTPDPAHNFHNVTLAASITDNFFLNETFIEGNWSNVFTNNSLRGPVGSSYNLTILSSNLSSREFIYYRFYANDTAGNMYITSWFNFSVVPSIANVSLISPLYEVNRYINETLYINATVTAVNGTIRNCMVNLSNQSGLAVIGDTNRTIGNLTNGATSQSVGWELNGTVPGLYFVNLTTNCTEGDASVTNTPSIEIISSLTNFSNTLYIEKRSIDGSKYFHSSADTAIHWWINASTYEEFVSLDPSRPQSAWFSSQWFIIVNNSIVLDFTNVTWDQQKAGINNESNTTFLQFSGRALGSSLAVNMTKTWSPHSTYDNISFDVQNIGNANFSDIKLKWSFTKFNIGNNSNTDTLLLINSTTEVENYSMAAPTSLLYNQSRFNDTRMFFADSFSHINGMLSWEQNMSINGGKTSLHNFTMQASGSAFSVNLTFHLGDLNTTVKKSLDPGAGLATPGNIRRTSALVNFTSNESGTAYTDVTIPLTDNNLATQDFIEARTGDSVYVLNIVNNTDISPFDQIFLRVRVDSMEASPYPAFVFAYKPSNVTVNDTVYGNYTFVSGDANTWVNINITNAAHLQDGYGYIRVRLAPNASAIANNKKLLFDEIRFNFTDMTPPKITLVSPADDFNTTSSAVLFNFTVSDKVDMNLTCNVTLDGIVNQSLLNISNGTSYNFTVVNLSVGAHRWNVTCWDDYGNFNTSLTRNFTIVRGPSSIVIELAPDNETLNLSWSALPWADYYHVHIINSFTDAFSATPNVTVWDANFTDRNAGNLTSRFYRIYAVKGTINHTTNLTVGKYKIELINNSNEVTDWHLISLPLNITNFNLTNGTNAGMDLSVKPHGCIKSLYFYNATIPKFMRTDYNGSAWLPAAGSENFTYLKPGVGYWAEINISCNLTLVGEVPLFNITSQLETGWNVLGWYSPNISDLPMDFAPAYPVVVNPEDSIQAIDRYNPVTNQFEVTIHYSFGGSAWGWWPSYNNQDFTSLEPSKGYYFDSASASTWVHQPNTRRDD